MTASRGKVRKYLGMTLDYNVCGQVQITMIDFLDKVLIAFDKAEPKGGGTKKSAASENLSKVDKDCKNLPQIKTVQFHNLVAKTLYATKQARPDTCKTVTFLTKRVQAPDLDYWANMLHMIRYIRGTRMLPLILSSNGSGIFEVVRGRIVCCLS